MKLDMPQPPPKRMVRDYYITKKEAAQVFVGPAIIIVAMIAWVMAALCSQ